MKHFFKSFPLAVSVAAALCAHPAQSRAQELAISTNIVDIARTGTANMEASYALARHWSVNAGAKYDRGGLNRQQLYSLGTRFWPWHIYSGWWFSGKLQYQEFNESESVTLLTSEGDRYGASLSGGYARMLGTHINVDVGVGLWGGYTRYVNYSCPTCGRIIGGGRSAFLLPDSITIALCYIF